MDEPDRSSTPPQEADDQPPPSPSFRSAPTSIELEVHDPTCALTPQELRTLTDMGQRVLAQLPNTGSVRVRIVDDEAMIRAHAQYSNIRSTTDVLTFDLAQHEPDHQTKALDTDLIVCADEARRQAEPRPHTHIHELLLYIIHGTLHCIGYDDLDEHAYQRMHDREDQLLSAAGFGPIFSAQPDAPAPHGAHQ